MQAESACRLALIEAEDFRRLALATPAVHHRVMQQVAPVMSRVTAIEQNRERLASLGTMAAGLAHELNNPAAAARRAAAEMAEALDVVSSTIGASSSRASSASEAEELVALQHEALDGAAAQTALGALDAADAEEALLERLEGLGVAEPLAARRAAGRRRRRRGVAGARRPRSPGPATDAALRWVAASLTARGLAAELQRVHGAHVEPRRRGQDLRLHGPRRARRGRPARGPGDDADGPRAQAQAHVDRGRARLRPRLPQLTVHGSELNQVWTNLLDNAIDALGEQGTITIATRRDGDCALVDITDDGPGIAPEIRDRVFDSFFTTKDVGAGTGLGLATARRIVVDRHDGSLTFDSEPGRTTFHVWLPLT